MFSDLTPENLYFIIFDYAKMVVPSLITFFVTRYSLNRPKKYEIRKVQFENVYLPLYLLTEQFFNQKITQEHQNIYLKKVEKIIYKNYPYAFPKTLKLLEKLKVSTNDNQANFYNLSCFRYQVCSDYDKLKRNLGFPCDSIFDFFKRLNKLDKLIYCLIILSLLLGSYGIVSFIYYALIFDIVKTLYSVFLIFISAILFYVFLYLRH